MQLSIQAHAQQQADELVHGWGKRAHVQIGKVRYHLLRNGLILHDIHIQRGNDKVDIAQMLLRANPKLLTGSTPRIGMVAISGLHAEITDAGNADVWKHDPYLTQLWQATTSLSLHGGNIDLYRDQRDVPALTLRGISIQQRLQSSLRSMTASARSGRSGRLSWQWQQHTAHQGMPAQTTADQASGGWLTKGALNWHGLDMSRLLPALHLNAMPGHLDGSLAWTTGAAVSGQQSAFLVRGQMQIHVGSDAAASNTHHLQFSASTTGEDWRMDMEATAWPLDPWSEMLPIIAKRQLISAQLDGKMQWQGKPGNWSVSSDHGLLQDVIYARPDNSEKSAWYWSRIRYDHAALDMAAHRLRLSRLELLDSRLVFQMQQNEQAIGGQQTGWDFNADSIGIHNMMLALAMPQGKLTLAALDGQAHCPQGKPLHFKLKTSDKSPPASSAATDVVAPIWQLQGKAEKSIRGIWNTVGIAVIGKHIPVARLRPLLPLQDDADRPVKLTGVTDLKVTATISDAVWRMQGRASIHDVRLEHGGNLWQADQLDVHFGPVGPGMEMQQIARIESHNWQYIAALHPLQLQLNAQEINTDASDENHNAVNSVWWVSSLRNHHIAIHHLVLDNGKISVGQPQSVWVNRVKFTADHIGAEQWADIALQGNVDGSPLYLRGQWQPLSDIPRFRGDAGFDQATPFFLHHWMHASAMPRLLRGRLSASLHITDTEDADNYQGSVKLQLLQGLTESGVFPSDPMLARTGYATSELLHHLEQSSGVIALQYDLNGNWKTAPLTLERLAASALDAMHQVALNNTPHKHSISTGQQGSATVAARIRLHDHERLSQNERNRLSKVVHLLRSHAELILDLRARWVGKEITDKMLQRIRFSQQLIEDYFTYRKIDKRRIFPLWPTTVDRADEAGSIQMETRVAG